jgi:hypothetical protein
MPAVGGDILEIVASHPTLGNKVFSPKANEGNTLDTGGLRTEDDADSVAGNGEPIFKINRKLGMFEVVVANDMNINKELEFAAALSGDPVPATWTITHVNGTIYSGSGKPVGDIQANMNDATFTLKVNGGPFVAQ